MVANRQEGIPKANLQDAGYVLSKAGISAIPVFGGPIAEVLSAIIAPPLSRRREEWLCSIEDGLKQLEKKIDGFKIEKLSLNESFVTTVLYASQQAIQNHQKEKLEALRNAVLNAALPGSPEEDRQLLFLSFVDSLTVMHLKFLKQLVGKDLSRTKTCVATAESERLLELLTPLPIQDNKEIIQLIGKDLIARGLIKTENFDFNYPEKRYDSFASIEVTDLGCQFLRFIAVPILGDDRS